ncbi:hypothetical protein BHX94_12125 (plasmid) [Macrococcoides bohemicum]|uniref:Uncharacterized protein n=1 Tax=Macrococcoides bohemicum TaxID=1903056 RepID=A0A328A032_9STAP|nr:hypothetical protein [Macrococcus bohemicus]RAK47822.1 hypothetical protein BHX94_12125 [Macrococcus bohemicus]
MFSKATLIDIMSLLKDVKSHSELDVYFFKYNLDKIALGANKDQRILAVTEYLYNNPKAKGIISDNLSYEIVEETLNFVSQSTFYNDNVENIFINYPKLRRYLLKDGFVFEDNKLIRIFDQNLESNHNETLIETLLTKHKLEIAKGHYIQASNAFNRGDWAACNAQLRTYVEELLNKIAENITGKSFSESHEAKIALSKTQPPIFYKELNEWLDNGQGYFETFWKRLHTHGSHPGLSNEEDSIFRLNLVQISTLEILKRYDRNFSVRKKINEE